MHLSIRTKFLAGFTAVLVMLSLVAGVGIVQAQRNGDKTEQLYQSEVQGSILVGQVRRDFEDYRARLNSLVTLPQVPRETLDQALATMTANGAGTDVATLRESLNPDSLTGTALRIDGGFASLKTVLHDPKEIEALEGFEQEWVAYRTVATTQVIPAVKRSDGVGALLELQMQAEPAYQRAARRSRELIAWNEVASKSLYDSTLSTAETARTISLAVSGAAIVIGLGLAFWLSRSIVGPVKELTSVAERVSMGDLDVTVVRRSNDEIGDLADSFSRMVTAVKFYAAEEDGGSETTEEAA